MEIAIVSTPSTQSTHGRASGSVDQLQGMRRIIGRSATGGGQVGGIGLP